MKKNVRIFFLMNLLGLSFSLYSNIVNRLGNIRILQDSPRLDNFGYVGSNIEKNGELNVIKNLIKEGDVVFDVGANVGKWSKTVFTYVGDVGIYAFEPVESLYNIMLGALNTKNIFTYNLALSDIQGSQKFYFYPNDSGKSGFYDREILRELCHLEPREINVQVDTLDSFCEKKGIMNIDFLKIDTEGEEFRVLFGAYNLLKQNFIRTIQFEYGGCYIDSKTTLKDVYNLLSGCGYSVFRIIPGGLIRISEWRDGLENFKYCNYLAILE